MDKIYVQLYSLSEESELSMEQKLRTVSDIGFSGVEFAGGYQDIPVKTMKQWLDQYHLEAVSAHVGLDAIGQDLPYLAELGVKLIVVPSHPFANRQEALELAQGLNERGRECAAYGIRVGFHNHTSEFYPEAGKPLLDYVIEATDPATVSFELDCGWASAAGLNPADYIRQHAGRFGAVHVKDTREVVGPDQPHSAGQPRPQFERDAEGHPIIPEELRKKFEQRRQLNVAMGTGIVDWQAVKRACDSQGKVYYIIEREWSYSEPPDRVQCLREDFAYVNEQL